MMSQTRKRVVALFFISLMVVNEAAFIQRNAAATMAVMSVSQMFRAMGKRMNVKDAMNTDGVAGDLFESFANITKHIRSSHSDHSDGVSGMESITCDRDIMVELSFGTDRTEKETLTIRADQYRDAGEAGFVFALKQTPGIWCTRLYSIKCVEGVANWEEKKLGCLAMNPIGVLTLDANSMLKPDNGTYVRQFGHLWNTYQEVSASGEEQIVNSRYMPDFPTSTKYIKVTPAPAVLSCPEVLSQAEAAERDFVDMISGLCQAGGDAADEKNTIGSCSMRPETTPEMTQFARIVNTFLSAKGAVQKLGCASAGDGPDAPTADMMMSSPVMEALKSLYSKMQSTNMTTETSSDTFAEAIGAITGIKEKCGSDDQCIMASASDTSGLLGKLWSGLGHDQKPQADASKTAEDDGESGGEDVTAEKLMQFATQLEADAASSKQASGSSPSSLLESDIGDAHIDFWVILKWAAGIAAVLLFLYAFISILISILVFMVIHWTIIVVLVFGSVVMFQLLKLMCGSHGMSKVASLACNDSPSHYRAVAHRRGGDYLRRYNYFAGLTGSH